MKKQKIHWQELSSFILEIVMEHLKDVQGKTHFILPTSDQGKFLEVWPRCTDFLPIFATGNFYKKMNLVRLQANLLCIQVNLDQFKWISVNLSNLITMIQTLIL